MAHNRTYSEPAKVPMELSVGEVAARAGVRVSALHFYEAEGLIHSQRNPGNQRRYAREVLRRIAVIKAAQRTGIPLSRIREALNALPERRTPTSEDWQKLSGSWRAELDERITHLTRLRDELDGCIGCGCLSMESCPLRNPWDRLASEGPGARILERENIPHQQSKTDREKAINRTKVLPKSCR